MSVLEPMKAYCLIGSIGTSVSDIRIRLQQCSFKEVIFNIFISLNVVEYVRKVFGISNIGQKLKWVRNVDTEFLCVLNSEHYIWQRRPPTHPFTHPFTPNTDEGGGWRPSFPNPRCSTVSDLWVEWVYNFLQCCLFCRHRWDVCL